MGLLAMLLGPRLKTERPGPMDDFWYQPVGASASGLQVTPEMAMTISAVYAAVSIIASTVASLPLPVYRRLEKGKERATDHPLYDVLHDSPNAWQTAMEWREMMTGHVLLRGNAYSLIAPGTRGFVDQLIPLHPGRMVVEQMEDNRLRYRYRRSNGTEIMYPQEQMFHLRGLSSDGISGLSVVGLARDALGLTAAAEQFGARRFSQNASPGGVLEHPGTLGVEASARMKASWEAAHAGIANSHRVAILEEGMKWHEVGMSNEDAQFLGTRDFQVHDIARWFNMPVHMLRSATPTNSYASLEVMSLEFVVYTLRPWLVRWEQAIGRDMILEPQKYFAEHLVEGLLRGNVRDRYAAYAVGRQWGWLSANDVRALENMNPVAGGDDYLEPLNMVPSGTERADRAGGDEAPRPAAVRARGQLEMLATEAAGRVVRREVAAVGRAARRLADDAEGFRSWLDQFYAEHAEHVARAMHIARGDAQAYADGQRDAVLWGGVRVLEGWEQDVVPQLAELARSQGV